MITEKSVGAYKTISEVSKKVDVPSHVLRFWETKFTQVKPIKRSGGRRYYRLEDIEVLNQIRTLLYQEGYTIKGAQKVLKSNTKSNVEKTRVTSSKTPIENYDANSLDASMELTENLEVSKKILKLLKDSELRLEELISKISK